MIDSNGNLRCDGYGCNKKLGMHLQGRVEIPCPRCKRFNIFDTDKSKYYTLQHDIINKTYKSHKLLDLTKNE